MAILLNGNLLSLYLITLHSHEDYSYDYIACDNFFKWDMKGKAEHQPLNQMKN